MFSHGFFTRFWHALAGIFLPPMPTPLRLSFKTSKIFHCLWWEMRTHICCPDLWPLLLHFWQLLTFGFGIPVASNLQIRRQCLLVNCLFSIESCIAVIRSYSSVPPEFQAIRRAFPERRRILLCATLPTTRTAGECPISRNKSSISYLWCRNH